MAIVIGSVGKNEMAAASLKRAQEWVASAFPCEVLSYYQDEHTFIGVAGGVISCTGDYVAVVDAHFSPEHVIDLYRQYGEACVDQLEGSYSFVIWNRSLKKLLLAVDQMGARPMYYSDNEDCFLFGSQFDGVLAALDIQPVFNPDCIWEYIRRNIDATLTYANGIHRLTAAGYFYFGINEKIRVRQASGFAYRKVDAPRTDAGWVTAYQEALRDAVTDTLLPDITIGVTLSGGLDSSAIACILAKQLARAGRTLHCFCATVPEDFPDSITDERIYMQAVADKYPNIKLHFIDIPDTGIFDGLDEAIKTEPTLPNIFHYHDRAILEAAKACGVKQLYTGYGGDYFASWSGDSVAFAYWQKQRYRKAFRLLRQRACAEGISLRRSFYRNIVRRSNTLKWLQGRLRERKIHSLEPSKVLTWKLKGVTEGEIARLDHKKQMALIIRNGSMGRIISGIHAAAARYGIEFRFPALDLNLLSLLAAMPLELFVMDGKRRGMIRKAMRGVVPDLVLDRNDKQAYSPGYHHRFKNSQQTICELLYPETPQPYGQFLNLQPLRDYYHQWLSGTTSQYVPGSDIRFMQWMTILLILRGKLGHELLYDIWPNVKAAQ
ncbi:asparagine synthase-related protein [Niabella yanshanensis]|uniref:asparagine synthase (glutamine-hydrolyzing) n=1 Tax=Niabella yanshanensis TaxID=577386 RepID=A0ABZ0W3U2_9BACT|nr:asparagine synthase-related protein [Niabella yanshanensis]WQD37801.1 asparagine synthase-related protein [Niabella yanshanensis]